jgi:hypothetical protein
MEWAMSSIVRFRILPITAIVLILVFATVASAAARPPAPTPLPPTPSNDLIETPYEIRSLPYTSTQDTRGATRSSTDPDCNGTAIAIDGRSVWYEFHPTDTSDVAISTEGSNYDTVLSVYHVDGDGRTGMSLTQVACDDDSGIGLSSYLVYGVTGGETYLILVAAFGSGAGGDLVLNVTPN